MKTIHINCDLGEGGAYDAQIMPLISACNVACGGHAGTKDLMCKTVILALENRVEIGAHPSYPDKAHFGRKSMEMTEKDLKYSLRSQILGIKQIIEAAGGKLSHIKAHGALYHDIAKSEKIASLFLDVVLELGGGLMIYVPPNSQISKRAKDRIKVVFEAFADRNYNNDYSLVSRERPNAVIAQKELVFDHLSTMFFDQKISCENGLEIPCFADTFCLHSDTPNAMEILRFLKQKFNENMVQIKKS